jgi:hypothetical protein
MRYPITTIKSKDPSPSNYFYGGEYDCDQMGLTFPDSSILVYYL